MAKGPKPFYITSILTQDLIICKIIGNVLVFVLVHTNKRLNGANSEVQPTRTFL